MLWSSKRRKKRWCRDDGNYWLTRIQGESMYLKSMVIPLVRGRHEVRIKHVDENGSCEAEYYWPSRMNNNPR